MMNRKVCLIVLDFEKNYSFIAQDAIQNYSFIVQDAIQGFHWNSSQARLHPMVMHFKVNGADKDQSVVYICNHKTDDTIYVYYF